jgi:starch-binding outer membrane protein, SusD/RagB family
MIMRAGGATRRDTSARPSWHAPRTTRWPRRLLLTSCLALAACGADRLTVPNLNSPTPDALAGDAATNVQTRATGILNLARRNVSWNSDAGMFGRESFNYFLTDSRVTTQFFDKPGIDPAGGAAGSWTGFFTTLRAAFDFVAVVDSLPAGALTAQQRSAAKGFAHTIEAYELSILISSRDSLGIPVEITADPQALAPFVSRDSAYNYIIARLDLAKTELQAGGSAFPFRLNAGFNGLNTPATFLRFNRGLAARINAYRASLGVSGCGAPRSAPCYAAALTNLSESFLDPAASLSFGAYFVFSQAANDVPNPFSPAITANYVLHPSIGPDAPRRADGASDLRYQAKVRRLATPRGYPTPGLSIPTDYAFNLYPAANSPIPIMKNEELLLLRAEARYFAGDIPGALADINFIRVNSGGLAPISGFADREAFITELLLQRRYSLLFEGHRWVDVRRFDRLSTLPIDIPARQHIATRQPVPSAECLARRGSPSPGPGCA